MDRALGHAQKYCSKHSKILQRSSCCQPGRYGIGPYGNALRERIAFPGVFGIIKYRVRIGAF